MKAAMPRHFSFSVFVFSQVLIDCEVLFFWIVQGEPRHPYLHTYVGAALVAIVSFVPGRRVCVWALGIWNAQMNPAQARWLAFGPEISRRAAFWGAVIGAYSHVLMDSIMHSDMHPFAPLSDDRSLLSIVSVDQLHLVCVVSGILGVAVLAVMRCLRRL